MGHPILIYDIDGLTSTTHGPVEMLPTIIMVPGIAIAKETPGDLRGLKMGRELGFEGGEEPRGSQIWGLASPGLRRNGLENGETFWA